MTSINSSQYVHHISTEKFVNEFETQVPSLSSIAQTAFQAYSSEVKKKSSEVAELREYTISDSKLHSINEDLKTRVIFGCMVGAFAKLEAMHPEGFAIPMSNLVTRDFYHCWIQTFSEYQPTLVALNALGCLSKKEYAEIAFEMRHTARLEARTQMPDRGAVAAIQRRDLATYGHQDGPTFELLYQRGIGRGLSENAACSRIIESSTRTNATADAFIEIVRIFPILDSLISFD